jgi:amino acid adenylation domain-containing protein
MTLIDVLARHARARGDRVAYVFLADGDRAVELTWAELAREVAAVSARLTKVVAPGERALLVYPPGLEFVTAFLGCLAAGVIAVPAYPPDPARLARTLPRLRAIARDAGAKVVLSTTAIVNMAAMIGSDAVELTAARWIATDLVEDEYRNLQIFQNGKRTDSTAFLQYTSGSTSTPRGVVISHENLIANQQAITAAFGTCEDDVIVGWLPLYHDMGLIGNVLHPLWLGARCVLMSPMSFLQRPRRWLDAISRYRGTVSGGPNFAFDLCVRRTSEEDRAALDLSSWRLAFSGAEPVRAATLARFGEAFLPSRFDRRAFYPCYGLAEATLLVTGGTSGAGATQIGLDRSALASGQTRAGEEQHVGCGQVAAGHELAIVEPATGVRCREGVVGEIWVQGPSVAKAYWGKPDDSQRTFEAALEGHVGPWLRTGDLGVLVDGQLVVAGRIKDVIIVRGRNIYPQDLELAAEQASARIRPGCVAAFWDEELVVVAEVDSGDDAIAAAVRGALSEACEVAVAKVVLVARGTIPKTSSGKIQRHATKEAWRAGQLSVIGRDAVGRQEASGAAGSAAPGLAAMRAVVARILGVAEVPADVALTSMGLDSLGATELVAATEALGIHVDVTRVLAGATLAELAGAPAAVAAASATVAAAAVSVAAPAAASEPLEGPVSCGQRAMWLVAKLAPESPALHVAQALRLRGKIDARALHGALQRVMDRHPALRTSFGEGDEPRQYVAPWLPANLVREDASGLDEAAFERRLTALASEPFELAHGPLLRAVLLVRAPDELVLLLCAHHAIIDLASLLIVIRELDEGYGAMVARRALPPVEVAPGPVGFAAREAGWLAGPGAADQAWWLEHLRALPVLDLPGDRPRPAVPSLRGAMVRRRVAATGISELARAHGATSFAVIAAAYAAMLRRHSGCDEVVLGTPTSNRGRAADVGVVGYLVSPVALRVELRDARFSDVVERVAREVREALGRAAVPVAELVARLGARRGLYEVALAFEQGRDPLGRALAAAAVGAPSRLALFGGSAEAVPVPIAGAQLDLMLRVAEHEGELEVALEYATELFDERTAAAMLDHFATSLADGVARPDTALDALRWAGDQERRALLDDLDETAGFAVPDVRLGEAFWAHAAVAPGDVAIIAGSERISYGALAGEAAAVAQALIAQGVGRGDRVAVSLPRTPALISTLLGILRIGAAYVPVDPRYPEVRRQAILEDAAPRMVLHEPIDVRGVAAALPPPCPALAGDLAYVLFTSGSTGRPKGVAIEHASAVAFLAWCSEAFTADELARTLFGTSLNFDLSVFEIFAPLARGGAVVLASDVLELPELPAAAEVTLINTVPSVMRELLALGGVPASVRTVNLAGEPLPLELAAELHRTCDLERLWNLYGPTEDTTYSTGVVIKRGAARVTIGKPIRGTRAYVLDAAGQLVPRGTPGELYLAGAGLARGYFGQPALTDERFVADPFGGGRMYRTGDLVRLDAEGELVYLGRLDQQVKIRGFRIELGEIDGALRRQPGVEEVAVVAHGAAHGAALVAYVVGTAPVEALRAALREGLPEFMIPAAIIALPALPRTPNGKLDRAKLPAPVLAGSGAAPRTGWERAVAAVFGEVLGVTQVGVEDDFFSLGGHSLAATRVVAQLRRELRVELPMRAVFEAPTVAALAVRLAAAGAALPPSLAAQPPSLAAHDHSVELSVAEAQIWSAHQLTPLSTRWHLAATLTLRGPLDPAFLVAAWEAMVRRHEALRTRIVVDEDGRPRREISALAPPLVVLEAGPDAAASGGDPEALIASVRDELMRRPFDLADEPPLRARLVRFADQGHALVVVVHHVAVDGWSVRLLFDELIAHLAGAPLAPPGLTPANLASAQLADRPRREATTAACVEALRGAPALLELMPDALDASGASGRVELEVDREAIATVARTLGATPAAVLLAAWAVVLARHAGQRELVIGVPSAARDRAEYERVVGCLVTTVPIRIELDETAPAAALIARVAASLGRALDAQDVALADVVTALAVERAPGRAPLVQAIFGLQAAPIAARSIGELVVTPEVHRGDEPHAELALDLWDDGIRIAGALEHDHRYAAARAARWARSFEQVAASLAMDPTRLVGELLQLDEAELRQLGHGAEVAALVPVPQQLWARARATPSALAVRDGRCSLDYATLVAQAGDLSAALRARGIGPGDVVGVLTSRAVELVVAQLGVLAAGAAYLPLDAAHPDARHAAMLDDARAALVLTDPAHAERVAALCEASARRALVIDAAVAPTGANDDPAAPIVALEAAAYVIYTSGSTGQPKGVVVPHRGLAALVSWHLRAFEIDASDRATQLASPAFDASVWEIWPYLCAGASVHLIDDVTRALPEALAERLAELGATRAFLPTPVAEAMLAAPVVALPRLRTLLIGGDRLRRDPGARPFAIANCYGPTEATVVATWAVLGEGVGAPPIGRPIDGTQVFVVDEQGRPAPRGAAGELWIGGQGLALGYLGREDLSAERFVAASFAPGRWYRTGDRARWREDGQLEFLGRVDRQLKVRGIRVEPAELEAALLAVAGVREAAVELIDGLLVAYVAGAGAASAELRAALQERLPEAVIPQVFVALPALPRTPSGKLDRGALPAPERRASRAPEGALERELAGLIAEILECGPVDAEADFFALGGHSISAARLAARIRTSFGVDLSVRVVFEAPTVAELARRVAAAPTTQAVPRGSATELLSFAEQRFWFLEQFAPGAIEHVIAGAVRLRGPLVVRALEAALGDVIARHDGLRTTFPAHDGIPLRVVAAAQMLALPVLGPVSPQDGARALASAPFELGVGPLFRAELHRLDEAEHLLCVALHHVIADGWSVRVLLEDLATAYQARLGDGTGNGGAPPWAPLQVSLGDLAVWQRGRTDALDQTVAWWSAALAGAPAELPLPTDRARPPLFSGRGAHHRFSVDARLVDRCREVAAWRGTTLSTVLLSAWAALLARLSGEAEVVIGVPAARRDRAELERVIGCLVDTLPVRLRVDGAASGATLIDEVGARVADALAHAEAPFERIVEQLRRPRDLARTPVFQAMFAFDAEPLPQRRVGELVLETIGAELDAARTDLVLDLKARGGGELDGVVEYAADLFTPATIAAWLAAYQRLLAGIVDEVEAPLERLALISAAERHHVLVTLARGPVVPRAELVLDRLAAVVARSPEAVALSQGAREMCYRELFDRACQLGHRLRRRGVAAGDVVAVNVARSPEAIVALLGVLAAGGAFLAIDPALPAARVQGMLEEAGVRETIDGVALSELAALDGEPWAPPAAPHADDLAYVIYTSGSTGTPKGVAISHRAIANRLAWGDAAHPTRPDDVFVQSTSIGFDVAVWEILTPLVAGARLVLPPPSAHAEVEPLLELIADQRVSVAGLTPSLLAAALDLPAFARCQALRLLFAGGEALPGAIATRVARLLPHVALWNFYGPTEATIDATCRRCGPRELAAVVPIGRPVGGAITVVLDHRLQPCPVGVAGELWIGGAGLARGYLGDPARTFERFVASPLSEVPGRLYRTGDRARWSPEGELEYLGRIDAQVKLRGFRIELGEIEAVLRTHPDLEDVAVVVHRSELPLERALSQLDAIAPPG